jgi:hypothetical protein
MKPRGIIARRQLIPGWQVVQCRALYDGSYVWYNCEATGLWQRTYPLSEVNLFLEDYPSLKLHHQLKQQPPLIPTFTQPLPYVFVHGFSTGFTTHLAAVSGQEHIFNVLRLYVIIS